MSSTDPASGSKPDLTLRLSPDSESTIATPIMAALAAWVAISLGFYGLKMLMQERPEFVGQPLTVTKAQLIQESPQVVLRRVSDDVSVIKPAQPESSEVTFDMAGRRDYRGLRTIRDMAGEVHIRHQLTNQLEEPVFVLFKCPHPRTEDGESQALLAGDLRFQSSLEGTQENTKNSWFWSGMIPGHGSAGMEISYRVSALKGVTYRVSGPDGTQVSRLRVSFHRQDLAAMRFETGEGTQRPVDESVVWERRNFLGPDFFSAHLEESRNMYDSLGRLLEIGPLICLLFLLATGAVILARQPMTALQMLTLAAGYAVYFPLILYLSANLRFAWALIIALVVPGALVVNYARWLLPGRMGLFGGALFLGLYQAFPTLAAFAGWNRGMVLLCLGVVTLAVLINLQNQALRKAARAAALLTLLAALPLAAGAAEIQVLLPAELTNRVIETKHEPTNALVSFEPAEYRVAQEGNFFNVETRVPFQVVRAGEAPLPLFSLPVYLQVSKVESPEAETARIVTFTNRLALVALHAGAGTLHFNYRAPVENREGKKRAQIPLLTGLSGTLQLPAGRANLELVTGSLWTKSTQGDKADYTIGVAGEDCLVLEWRDGPVEPAPTPPKPAEIAPPSIAKDFYGIGLKRAQNLTLINSDGSCAHFAEYEIPVSQGDEFRLRLPANARLVSVSVNGAELSSPAVEASLCRIPLPDRQGAQTTHRLSFRIAYPAVQLGFAGRLDLELPELFQTSGSLEWVVALPPVFETQVLSSGLETQKSPPDLARFGDYGRILQAHVQTSLAKELAPPGAVALTLKYRQVVPALEDARGQ
jgi:hypothetical protein